MKSEKEFNFTNNFTFIVNDNECNVFAKKKGEEKGEVEKGGRCACGLLTWACKYPSCEKGK